jgi:ABC-2 type transport system ATP-binding protein
MKNALEINNCHKTYSNGTVAVRGVSLTVASGDFFALLGPNGAGKSTTIGMIASLVKPDSGSIKIFGEDMSTNPGAVKQKLGIMPQEVNFNIFETSHNILKYNAALYGIKPKEANPRIEMLMKELNLWDKKDRKVRTLSGGYKRRLMLARALVHNPKLLLLDEPTAGVDVETRNATWEFIKKINQAGTTVILTTHYLEEAESLCNKVAIVNHGKLLQQSSMDSLLRTLETESLILYLQNPIVKNLDIPELNLEFNSETELEVKIHKNTSINSVLSVLSKHNIEVSSIKNKRNRLEELFIKLTQ